MILTSKRLWSGLDVYSALCHVGLEKWVFCAQEHNTTTVLVPLHVHKATQHCHLSLLFKRLSEWKQMVTKYLSRVPTGFGENLRALTLLRLRSLRGEVLGTEYCTLSESL